MTGGRAPTASSLSRIAELVYYWLIEFHIFKLLNIVDLENKVFVESYNHKTWSSFLMIIILNLQGLEICAILARDSGNVYTKLNFSDCIVCVFKLIAECLLL